MIESSALLMDNVLPRQPMRQWVLSVPFPLRFLFASQPKVMSKVLGIVHRVISTYLIKKAGFGKKTARTGAVTLIQRFGSALNLNVHFHMLFLDGVYVDEMKSGDQRFITVSKHRTEDIAKLVHQISLGIARYLTRAGLIESDAENCYLSGAMTANEMTEHQSYSIHYRIAAGPQKGKKVFTIQMRPPVVEEPQNNELLAKLAGFSLHAEVGALSHERDKLERLCRYILRPPVAIHRLSLTPSGDICYQLKTPYRNGTTHVVFEPLDFISKLAALVPSARVNLTRFFGVFAPNSSHRATIIIGKSSKINAESESQATAEKRKGMTWAARLKRAFNIDIKTCQACGGAAKVIACIDDPIIIIKILNHLQVKQTEFILPITRAPPANSLFN